MTRVTYFGLCCLGLAVALTQPSWVASADTGRLPTQGTSFLDDLHLSDVDGAPFNGGQALTGATVVGIWATWCQSCRHELPELVRLEEELAARGMTLILVSVDRQPIKGARYLEQLGYEGLQAFDPGARSILESGIDGIPTVVVLDRDGRVATSVSGAGEGSLEVIRRSVTAILSQPDGVHHAD